MKIRLKNFRSYEDETFDLGTDGLVLITAPSGSGKSNILLGINFALYGTGTKVVKHGKTSCSVELIFGDMKIVRSKRPNRLIVNDDYADDALSPLDLKIPSHFIDRVNDKRNRPEIKTDELYDFFDKLSDDKDDLIAMLNRGEEVVATDSQSKINIPLTKDKNSQLKSKVKTVAKTIMRKDNFQTTSPKLVFEEDFFEPIEDKQSDLNISSEPTRVDYYKDHIQNVVPSDFKVEKQKDKIVVTPTPKHKQNLENNPEFKELLVSLTMHMMDNINIEPLPDLIFIEDDTQNAKDMLGRTAHYNHNDKTITLYTYGRHPKDILRSYAHEMIHHKQNLEGRLKNKINTQNINEDDYLKEIEEEAYRLGNGLLFREWENSL